MVNDMNKNLCTMCSSSNICDIYTFDACPLFQNRIYHSFYAAKNATCGPVVLSQCECGFVFNRLFDYGLMNYDEDYDNDQSNSDFFCAHAEEVCDLLDQKCFKEKRIVEIGCGKGFFLELLIKKGFNVTKAFDAAYEGNNHIVIKDYFSDKYHPINADLIILRHTLEHVINPFQFLNDIARCNDYQGKIFIEIPCWDWIVKKDAFWDVFYEHCNYFNRDVLSRVFGSFKTGVFFNGQYIYVLGDLASLKEKPNKSSNVKKSSSLFQDTFDNYKNLLHKNKKTIVWGAGAKGLTFLNVLDKEREYVSCIVDINKSKQNKFLGGTGHEIVSPEEMIKRWNGEPIIVMNDNYYQEIRAVLGNNYRITCL